MSEAIETTLLEVRRLISMSKKEREELGVYATFSDLTRLVKTLRSAEVSSQNERNLDSLYRVVGDYAERDSELYILVKRVID